MIHWVLFCINTIIYYIHDNSHIYNIYIQQSQYLFRS